MRKLVAANIVLGEPLPFSVYDDRGNLLLRKGVVISMPDQIDRLVMRGALIEGQEGSPLPNQPAAPVRSAPPRTTPLEPPFERITGLALNLKHIIATALRTPEQIDVGARIEKAARTVQEAVAADLGSALAAAYLDLQSPYLVAHLLTGGVLTEILARSQGLDAEARLPLVCAALTRDWGQLGLQTELDARAGPLPPEMAQKMRGHAERGAELLRLAGVTEPRWLEAVAGHHERLDGSGYPRGLAGEAVGSGSRIVALADAFSAMLRARPYREKPYYPQAALRELYVDRRQEYGEDLTAALIREIGILPPGAIVRLKCGEIAVIKNPAARAENAVAYAIYSRSGMVLAQPALRDTSTPDYGIAAPMSVAECKSAAVIMKRIWLGS